MPETSDLDRLRHLQQRTKLLYSHALDDIRQFVDKNNGVTFRRLTDSAMTDGISVASTATCLFFLRVSGLAKEFYGDEDSANRAIDLLLKAPWESHGLKDPNTFTSIMVLESLAPHPEIIKASHPLTQNSQTIEKPIPDIIGEIGQQLAKNGGITVQGYPRSACVTYWALRTLLNFSRPEILSDLGIVIDWAEEQVARQVAYVTAEDIDHIDIVQLAFSVSILEQVRKRGFLSEGSPVNSRKDGGAIGTRTLMKALTLVLESQEANGLWRKYQPLFHYPESGANYCFIFELVEAIIEACDELLSAQLSLTVTAFERIISWAEANRILGKTQGWNAGTPDARQRQVPESWATATAHLFFLRLIRFTSNAIRQQLLLEYEADNIEGRRDVKRWNGLVDSELSVDGTKTTLKKVIEEHVISPIEQAGSIPKRRSRISGVLFGPPGTAKTSIAKTVAYRLGWPFIQITPSLFIRDGYELIESRAVKIFKDLQDLGAIVVLFDEMDELLRERAAAPEAVSRFLTTSMLPKFQALHDQRKLLFFVATNFSKLLDPAIGRPGRFDMALHVPPPTTEQKIASIEAFEAVSALKNPARENLITLMRSKQKDLDYFNFGEFEALLQRVLRNRCAQQVLSTLNEELRVAFGEAVDDMYTNKILLREGGPYRADFDTDQKKSTLQ